MTSHPPTTSPSRTAPPAGAPPRALMQIMNPIMATILHSPLHGMVSGDILLLTFTGRKSGRQTTTPVTFRQAGNRLVVFSGGGWSRNLRGGAAVRLLWRGRTVAAQSEATDDPAAVRRETRAYLAAKGLRSARMIGLQLPQDREPTDAEIDTATRGRVVITIRPQAG